MTARLEYLLRIGMCALLMLPPALTRAAPSQGGGDYWLEASLDPAALWVQAQAVYRLRFYQALDVRGLQLHGPEAALVELRTLGADRVLEEMRAGRRYRVTERRYALTPFASGELQLKGGYATGSVPAPGAMTPDERQSVRLDAGHSVVKVLPIPPQAASAPWLPARSLKLTEVWSTDLSAARQGEALRRTLRIQAVGTDAAQIPQLAATAEGFSVHPEPARIENRLEGDWTVGVREQSYRLVPQRAGELALPELRLSWWDVVRGRLYVAAIPARTLAVAAVEGQPPLLASMPPEAAALPLPRTGHSVIDGIGDVLPYALAVVAALLLVLGTGLLLRRQTGWRRVRVACRRNDAPAAQQAVLQWAAQRWRGAPPRTLAEIAARLADPALAAALMELDRQLYGPPDLAWQGHALLDAFAGLLPAMQRVQPAALPSLYPD